MKIVPAKHFTKANRGTSDVTLVVIHTAECGEYKSSAENLQTWTAGPSASEASWHYAVDSDSVTQSVGEEHIAWHAGPVNDYSIGIEHAGFAAQTVEQWRDEFSVSMLERSAELLAAICLRYDIPCRRLTALDLSLGERAGITGHVDVVNGLQRGKGHQDPGPNFPWKWYLGRVMAHMQGVASEPSATLIPEPFEGAPVSVIPETERPLVMTPERGDAVDFSSFVDVEHEGVVWKVAPIYIAPVSLAEASEIAERAGCELPSPGLVDAIYRAADLRIDANKMIRHHDGTPKTMDSAETHADQAARLAAIVGDRSLGKDFFLLAGAFKDVCLKDGKRGLYGWHKADGTVIQGFFAGHAGAWRDYSQGVRLVKRA